MTADGLNLDDFNYDLPEDFIAQEPLAQRDQSKLMRLDRSTQTITHHLFRDIVDYINPGDVLVMNDTRVLPARLRAVKTQTGGALEILLLRKLNALRWRALVGGKRAVEGTQISLPGTDITATVVEAEEGPQRIIEFSAPIEEHLHAVGEIPLPPYIHTYLADPERYQTIYNKQEGSAAAPTAGLHFTPDLLIELRRRDVQFAYCTLHIGLDTFQPVREYNIRDHKIHSERALLTADNAHIINQAKLSGKRIIAVGTTSARTLETAAILSAGGGDPAHPESQGDLCPWRPVIAFEQDTNLFIYPGYAWRVVDALITNFHLPKSSLLMMISSFAGRAFILNAYEIAKRQQYRFFSFGDAMFIT